MRTPLTLADVERLPASVDLPTAGRAFNLGRTLAYRLARADEFPVPVHRHGRAYRVHTADILAALRRGPTHEPGSPVPGPSAPCPAGGDGGRREDAR